MSSSILASKYVADTMAFILRLEKRKMPQTVKLIFEEAEKGNLTILVPAMVFAELAYLSEGNKIKTNLNEASTYLQNNQSVLQQPINFESIAAAFKITDIPELHDRLIAGTALLNEVEIITNDPKIRTSKHVKSVWE